MRPLLIIVLYLGLALILEFAILQQLQWPANWLSLSQALDGRSLLPLAGILVGLLRGEIQGMLVAFAAACLFGFSQQMGQLGAAIDSFTFSAFMAGMLAQATRVQGLPSRWFTITGLLLAERLVWWLVRRIFWGSSSLWTYLSMSWPALVLTGLLGFFLYKWLGPRLRLKVYIDP